jgi:hypothetical protein
MAIFSTGKLSMVVFAQVEPCRHPVTPIVHLRYKKGDGRVGEV